MKAMILAAGLGKRMRPLTDNLPKPLLLCAGKPLIVYHIEALVAAGVKDIVINHAYLGEMIEETLQDGSAYGASIQYSAEKEPMNTGAGIANALPLLGDAPFILSNGDVWTDFDYSQLTQLDIDLAHLVMVANPEHNPQGDFSLTEKGFLLADRFSERGIGLTYSGIAVLHPELFSFCPSGPFPLRQPLIDAMATGKVSGRYFKGQWTDVGTPTRLKELERAILGAP
jgi:MurNAc alpha-1-phosphate uridylyltransferase|tara:strand:+ start:4384 stop:5064 length:681 start_codon:yes stop_codon:yes gene_type:complete